MAKTKGFGPRSTARPFTVATLASPAPGAYEVAIACPHGTFTVTVLPDGLFLSDAQLPHIPPGCIQWLAKNRDEVGRQVYGSPRPP
jgi:hypothetical protein